MISDRRSGLTSNQEAGPGGPHRRVHLKPSECAIRYRKDETALWRRHQHVGVVIDQLSENIGTIANE